MKYAKVILRFILMLIFSFTNLYANMQFCYWFKEQIPGWFGYGVVGVLVWVLMFIYFLFQIALVPYLNYRALKSGCIKYGISYR